MRSKVVPFGAVIAFIALFAVVPQARAQVEDTYVSSTGVNSGTCPISAPCLTIAFALTQTAVSGQVIILDSGDYAPFTISQTVAVRAIPGVFATVTATSGGTAVTVNAPNATVTLSDLHIFGFGQSGATGVQVNNAGKVQIYGGSVASFSGTGIVFAPAANGPSGNVQFILSGTNVGFNNSGNVLIMPTAATS